MHERTKVVCPIPRTGATGEHECPACGLRWESADGQPECDRQARGIDPAPQKLAFRRNLYRGAKGL